MLTSRGGGHLGDEPSADAQQALVQGFRERADHLRVRANAFLFAIIGVVLLGVTLILLLPPLIAKVDRAFSDVSPPEAAGRLETDIENRLESLREIDQRRIDLSEQLNDALAAPFAYWERIDTAKGAGAINAIASASTGGFVAVGNRGETASEEEILLLRSDAATDSPLQVRPSNGQSMAPLERSHRSAKRD